MELTFGKILRKLRKEKQLTLKQLADMARVPHTLLSALENNHQSVGEKNATKIGKALGLEGETLRDYIYLALNNSKHRILREHQDYSAELLNLLPTLLKNAGIAPEMVRYTILRPDWGNESADGAVMLFGNHPEVQIHLMKDGSPIEKTISQ